ncbi:MAG: ATP-binding protein [Nitrososphaeria archaeon]
MNMLIVGKTGSGKTYFLKRLLSKLIKKDDYLIWISNSTLDIDIKNVIEINHANIDFNKLLNKYHQIGIVYGLIDKNELTENIDRLCSEIWERRGKKNIYLVIDEAYEYYSKFQHSKMLEKLIRAGRKHRISIIMSTQQIIDLDLTFLKQSSYLIVFGLSENNDKYKVAKNLDLDVNQLNSINVANHEYLIKNLRTGEVSIGKET